MVDQWWLLVLLGLAVGAFGTLIGAGGGFVLMPILLLLMPKTDPAQLTAISLAVVFCNSTSGTVAYLRMGRVDLRSALWFALATLPGAIVGAFTTKFIPRLQFNVVFGALLAMVSIYLVLKPEPKGEKKEPSPKHITRAITDSEGTEHHYSFSMALGLGISVLVGFVSSLFGIGGGIIHVPVLNRTLNFPVHIATATSQAILCVMSLAGTIVHWNEGTLDGNLPTAAILGAGAIVGAQVGARLSKKLKGSWIIRALAIALGLVGLRLILPAFV